jgi:hypothetical protein
MMIDAYRRMSPREKLERVRSLSQAVYQLAAAGVRLRRPDASDEDVQVELAVRRLGRELVDRVIERRSKTDGG